MLKDYLSKLLALALVVFACATGTSQTSTFAVDNPTIGGDYPGIQYLYGPMLGGESGPVAIIDDGTGVTTGCVAASNDLTGAIALIDRGACAFTTKTTNAEAAGAIAVIICNVLSSNPDPDAFPSIGGGDCNVTIPTIGASFNTCETIKTELANGVTVTMPDFGIEEGEFMNHEIELPGAGMYSVDTIVGDTVLPEMLEVDFTGQTPPTAGVFYSIVAPADGVMNINSCLGGSDTRVWVFGGCRGGYGVIDRNDDAVSGECLIEPDGDPYASELNVLVTAGTEYVIAWDNTWSSSGFDFEVSFGDPVALNVTFTVDMSNETVASDGVFISGSPTGGVETAMTDNGDGTWSWTVEGALSGSTHTWQYLNGTGISEDLTGLEACGLDVGGGLFIRTATLNTLDDVVLDPVCFGSCFECPSDAPTDCAAPFVLIDDNLDAYTEGVNNLGPQADHWSTWSGDEGGAEDGNVSTAQASSGTNSLEVAGAAGGGPQDVILLLGAQVAGNYRLSWKMYIPEDNTAYFNLQHLEEFGGANGEWAIDVNFDADGGSVVVNSTNYTFDYPNAAWFDVIFNIDIDNDWATIYINNRPVYGWAFSQQNNAATGVLSLGAVDFYPRSPTDVYYIDDVFYAQYPPAADGNAYCHTATPIDLGTHTMTGADCIGAPDQTNAPAAAWYSYTAAEDGFCAISSCEAGSDSRVWIYNSCDMRGTLGVNDDECAMVAGSTVELYASYKEFAVTAGETYYIAWDNRWLADGETHDFTLDFFADEYAGDFCQTAIDIDLGTHSFDTWGWASQSGPEYGAFGDNTPYTRSKWFTYTPSEDILVRLYSCDLAVQDTRAWIYVGECGSYESLSLVQALSNECGMQEEFTWDAVAGTTYYIEWDDTGEDIEGHEFGLEEVVLETVSVTYQVDMTWYLDAGGTLETIKIAGDFATNSAIDMVDWDPAQSPAFTDIGDDVYEVTIDYLVEAIGQTQQYKFLNTADSWGECGIAQECFEEGSEDCTSGSPDFNRVLTIPAEDMTVCFTWETCEGCNLPNSTREALVDIPMTIAPNPFSQEAIVTFNEAIFEAEGKLTTLTGQVARTYQVNGTQLIIKKEDLTPGVYFFTVTTAEGVSTAEKLIVQ